MQLSKTFVSFLILFKLSTEFQFASLTVEATTNTINKNTTYKISYDRSVDDYQVATAYASVPILPSDTISVTFPDVFVLSNVGCIVSINGGGNELPGGCTVIGNVIVVSNFITTSTIISTIDLYLNPILNPSPATTTSNFIGKIGSDTSGQGSLAGSNIILSPDNFQMCHISFSPSTNVKESFQCLGDNSNARVTAMELLVANTSSVFSFSINGIRSPPTGEPLDAITITSTINGSAIDTCTAYVSGLQPKVISNFTITGSSTMPVNTQGFLRLQFTLPDWISQTDILILTFPLGSVISLFLPSISSTFTIIGTNTTYDQSTRKMYFVMQNQGRIFAAGAGLVLVVGNYTAPESTEETGLFTLEIGKIGYPKMVGEAKFKAIAGVINGSISTLDTIVNSITSYTFTLNIFDSLSTLAKIKISLPALITISSIPSCTSLPPLLTVPVCSYNSTEHSIILSSLSTTSINAGTYKITIGNIKNPFYSGNTGSFGINTYYGQRDEQLVATGQLSGISIEPGFISITSIEPTSSIASAEQVSYTITTSIIHPIYVGGTFRVLFPPEVSFQSLQLGGHCSIKIDSDAFYDTTCTASSGQEGTLVNFEGGILKNVSVGGTVGCRISGVLRNPRSTKPTSQFLVTTWHSNGRQISTSLPQSLTVQMLLPSQFEHAEITRLSNKNSEINSLTFKIKQKSILENNSVVLIEFGNGFGIGNISCTIAVPYNLQINCTSTGVNVRSVLPTEIPAETELSILISGIVNPASFEPTSSFTITSKLPGELYIYSSSVLNPGLINNEPSSFKNFSYDFSSTLLGEPTILTLKFMPSSIVPSSIRFTLSSSFVVSTLACSLVDLIGQCNIISSHVIEIPANFSLNIMTISISGFSSPLTSSSSPSTLASYSSQYKIDEFSNIAFTMACELPCKTCDINNKCLSCYQNTQITSLIYYSPELLECSATCRSLYFKNLTAFICQSCDTNCGDCLNSANNCVSCRANSTYIYLMGDVTNQTSKCVATCESGMFPDTSAPPIFCRKCESPCSLCKTLNLCLSCQPTFYLYLESCLLTCPPSISIPSPDNLTCDPCSVTCKTCENISTFCTSCHETYILYEGVCRTDCDQPLVIRNGTCGPCDQSCLRCINDMYSCTSCSNGKYLYNSRCQISCPSFYYENNGTNICESCSSVLNLHCQNCSSNSTCLSCDISYVLHENKCLSFTPAGYVNISGVAELCFDPCKTCINNQSYCQECKSGNFYQGQCLSGCPYKWTAVGGVCVECTGVCLECEGAADRCTSCKTPLSPPLFLTNFQCLESCPNSTYSSLSNLVCTSCHSPCENCISAGECKTCLNGFYLEGGNSCVEKCEPGYTGISRICIKCAPTCFTCNGTTTKCETCIDNLFFLASSSSCVEDCGPGLYEDILSKTCISCTSPCSTCINTTNTCLSCSSGSLMNNLCLVVCPKGFYELNQICHLCNENCSTCTSFFVCQSCVGLLVQFNGFCIEGCPETHSVIVDSICMPCSTAGCFKCNEADTCLTCNSNYSLLDFKCYNPCPLTYQTNGTHCIETNELVLTSSSTFPVPFSIVAVVLIIACLMSKLQYTYTFLPGAINSLIGVVEVGALGYYLFLVHERMFFNGGYGYYVGLAAAGWLVLVNLSAGIVGNIGICFDVSFSNWMRKRANKVCCILVNIVALSVNHKFRNILFCKLFNFEIFTATLSEPKIFKYLNIFAFLSLLHSGAAIFSAGLLITTFETNSQYQYACIDVIVVTGVNVVIGIFNVIKGSNYFYEKTQEGFELKKKFYGDGELLESKIEPTGKTNEDEEGYVSNIFRAQGGTGFRIRQYSRENDSDKEFSYGSLIEKSVDNNSRIEEDSAYEYDSELVTTKNKFNGLMPESQVSQNKKLEESVLKRSSEFPQRLYNHEMALEEKEKSMRITLRRLNESEEVGNLKPAALTRRTHGRRVIYDNSGEFFEDEKQKNMVYKPDMKIRSFRKNEERESIEEEKEREYDEEKKRGSDGIILTRGEKGSEEKKTKEEDNVNSHNNSNNNNHNNSHNNSHNSKEEEIINTKIDETKIENNDKAVDKISIPILDVNKENREIDDKIKIENMEVIGGVEIEDKIKGENLNESKETKENVLNKKLVENLDKQEPELEEKMEKSSSKNKSEKNDENFLLDEDYIQVEKEELIYEDEDEDGENKYEELEEKHNLNSENKLEIPESFRLIEFDDSEDKGLFNNKPNVQYEELEGDMSEGLEKSTKNQSSVPIKSRRLRNKNGYSFDDPVFINVDHEEIEMSGPEKSEGIHERPVGYNMAETEFSEALEPHKSRREINSMLNRRNMTTGDRSVGRERIWIENEGRYEEDVEEVRGNRKYVSQDLKLINEEKEKIKKMNNKNKVLSMNTFQFENTNGSSNSNRVKRARLVVPNETDRQRTEFKNPISLSQQKILYPRRTGRSMNYSLNKKSKIEGTHFTIENHEMTHPSMMSHHLSFGESEKFEHEPHIYEDEEGEISQYRNKATIEKMTSRPSNNDIQKYYEETKLKKEKSKKKASESHLATSRIYMQKQSSGQWK